MLPIKPIVSADTSLVWAASGISVIVPAEVALQTRRVRTKTAFLVISDPFCCEVRGTRMVGSVYSKRCHSIPQKSGLLGPPAAPGSGGDGHGGRRGFSRAPGRSEPGKHRLA